MSGSPGYVVLTVPKSQVVQGDIIQVTAEFYDVAGQLTNPSTATVKYSPAGTTTVSGPFSMTEGSTGVYTYDIDTTGMGAAELIIEAFGTGTVQTSGQITVNVTTLPF